MQLNRPSRTLSALTAKSYQFMQNNRLQPLASTTKRVKSGKKQSNQTQLDKKDLNTDDILLNLNQLDSQITEIKQIGVVKKDNTKYNNIALVDLLPVSINNEDTSQQVSKQQTTDQQVDDNLSIEEKLKIYRNNPALFQQVLLESKKVKQQEIDRQRQQQNSWRQKHRQEIAGDIPIPPMISNFIVHNKRELKSGKLQYDNLMTGRQIRGQLLEAQIDDALSRKRRILEVEEASKYPILFQPKRDVLLPRIYALQKQKLGIYLYFVSRIAALNQQTCKYQKLKFENIKIMQASNKICKNWREYAKDKYAKQVANAKIIIVQYCRYFRVRNQKNIRQKSLLKIKQLLLGNYNQNTFLGVVSNFEKIKDELKKSVNDYSVKNTARLQILKIYIKQNTDKLAYGLFVSQKEKLLATTLKKLQNDRKKTKELKAFMQQNPQGKQVQPESPDEFEQLTKMQLTEQQISLAADAFLHIFLDLESENLNARSFSNSSPGQLNITVINLIPDYQGINECYNVFKNGKDVQEWVSNASVDLQQPEEMK